MRYATRLLSLLGIAAGVERRSAGNAPSLTAQTERDRPSLDRLGVPSTPVLALADRTPAEHARRLVTWLQGDVSGSSITTSEPTCGAVLSRDAQRQHREMCAELGWNLRPWQRVSRELSLMISGGKKTWKWVTDEIGERHRLRVFHIPARGLAVVACRSSDATPRTNLASREVTPNHVNPNTERRAA